MIEGEWESLGGILQPARRVHQARNLQPTIGGQQLTPCINSWQETQPQLSYMHL